MKAVSLFSGGKDSFFSALIAMEQGFEIEYAITIDPEEYSMMFHYPNTQAADMAASLLGIKVRHVRESDFARAVEDARNHGIRALISGAIASEYQKTRIEELCTSLELISYTPIWRKNQKLILERMLETGLKAIIISVSAEGLVESDLGMSIDGDFIKKLSRIDEKIGINMAGEGGEYESFVKGLEGDGEIIFDKTSTEWKGSGGYLYIEKAHVQGTCIQQN